LEEHQHKRSIGDDALHLRQLDPFIGSLPLASVHAGTLRPFIDARRRQGRKAKTINLALGIVRHIHNLAASEWLDEHNLPPTVVTAVHFVVTAQLSSRVTSEADS